MLSTDFVGFVVPGTPARNALARKKPQSSTSPAKAGPIDPVTGFLSVAAPPKSGLGSRRRDLTAQIVAEFPTAGAMALATDAFDRLHLRPIAISTQKKLDIAKRAWLEWFTQLYRSVEKANATLVRGAPFPPLQQVKQLLHFMATKGASGLGIAGVTGWSMSTTRIFAGRVINMLRRCGTTPPSVYEREQINAAIAEWAYTDKHINTKKKPKRIVRENDLVELLAMGFKDVLKVASNFIRLQMMGIFSFIYTHGNRIGCILDADGYVGLGEHLKWKDSEWIIYGWDEGAGLGIQSFWVFHWMKGQRFNESDNVRTSMRNLGRSHAHLDSQLILEALAIHADIFVEDLLALRAADPATLTFPMRLTIKPECLELPVFRISEKSTECMHAKSAHDYANKFKSALRWENFTFVTLRYSFASAMVNRVSKLHLRYLMGHTAISRLSLTTYQAPDRPVDVSGTRFGEGEGAAFAAMSEAHSSVSWNRPAPPTTSTIKDDPVMQKLVAEWARREKLVREELGENKSSDQLFEEGNEHQVVLDALDIQAEVHEYYCSLSTAGATRNDIPVPRAASSTVGPSTVTPMVPSSSATASSAPASDTPAAEEPDNTLYDAMMDVFATADGTHPYLALIANEPSNPRLALIQRYVAFIRLDEQTGSRCTFCFTDPSLTPEQQNKNYAQNYVSHVSSCELTHNPGKWRCPICIELLPAVPKRSKTYKGPRSTLPTVSIPSIPPDDDLDEQERQGIHEAFVAHMEICFQRLLCIAAGEETDDEGDAGHTAVADSDVCMTSGRDSDVRMSTARDSESSIASIRSHAKVTRSRQKYRVDIPDGADGARALSIQVPFDAGRTQNRPLRLHSFLFCPVCTFDEELPWHERLMSHPNVQKLMIHIASHWRKGAVSSINYKLAFKCGLPPCSSEVVMDTRHMIEHLHQKHDYALIQCVDHCDESSDCDPERCTRDHHNDTCFKLPERFIFHNDALLLSDSRVPEAKRKAMPHATLVDYRKSDMQKRWWQGLCDKLKINSIQPILPISRRERRSARKIKPPSATEKPVVVRTEAYLIRACIADLATEYPDLAAIDAEQLVDSKLTLEQISLMPRPRMHEFCTFPFTFRQHTQFSDGVKRWRENVEIEDCVEVLVKAYPGVIKAELAGALQREKLTVCTFLEFAAEELVEFSLTVEPAVWLLMKASVDEWLKTRTLAG
ncbi:hypothetical protein C8R43DRAFT_271764 [Mycena crocata]|nr:hypothetical protein C8R43DRAFT_271764 [Mycena crocata]